MKELKGKKEKAKIKIARIVFEAMSPFVIS